jgi:hypothetical protein
MLAAVVCRRNVRVLMAQAYAAHVLICPGLNLSQRLHMVRVKRAFNLYL